MSDGGPTCFFFIGPAWEKPLVFVFRGPPAATPQTPFTGPRKPGGLKNFPPFPPPQRGEKSRRPASPPKNLPCSPSPFPFFLGPPPEPPPLGAATPHYPPRLFTEGPRFPPIFWRDFGGPANPRREACFTLVLPFPRGFCRTLSLNPFHKFFRLPPFSFCSFPTGFWRVPFFCRFWARGSRCPPLLALAAFFFRAPFFFAPGHQKSLLTAGPNRGATLFFNTPRPTALGPPSPRVRAPTPCPPRGKKIN